MDSTPTYITDFKAEMKQRHSLRKEEQQKDQEFFDNTYPLTLIKKVDYQMRTNFAARMINAVTQQLISNLPKAFVYPNKDNSAAKESSKSISIALNEWILYLLRQPINPFEQIFKYHNIKGEGWLYIPHNADKAKYGLSDYDMPTHFIMYDPMTVFAEPNEEVDGEPSRVIVSYMRNVAAIKKAYPMWTNPKQIPDSKKAEFVLYFDKEKSYAEADNEPLFRDKKDKTKLLNGTGERTNPYGLVPFVHMYSGWGSQSEDDNPASLAYSRIRLLRDLITEDSQVRSDQLYNFHAFAHKSRTLYLPAGGEVSPDWAAAFKNDPDKLNQITLPEGANPEWFKVDDSQLFDPAAFAYADRVRMDLGMEFPAPLQGGTGTSSGREANILSGNALAIYDCAVENTSLLWSKAFIKALKIADKLNILPEGVSKEDLGRIKEVTIDLRTDDPVARDRQINMGSVLVDNGKRSIKTFLMEDMRMTDEESDEEIDNILADRIMLQSPEIAEFLGMKAAEKSGMAEELAAFRAMRAEQGQRPQVAMGSQVGSKGGQPRQGNIKTETGREQVDVSQSSYGQRTPVGG